MPSARGLVLPADVWLAYDAGAVIVGIIAVRWPSGVLSVPVAVLALVIVIAVARFRRRGKGDERRSFSGSAHPGKVAFY
jgi:membrane protein implicated in regulation of membrane protease activity